MATTGAPGNIPLLDDDSPITPIQVPFNAVATALNTALGRSMGALHITRNANQGIAAGALITAVNGSVASDSINYDAWGTYTPSAGSIVLKQGIYSISFTISLTVRPGGGRTLASIVQDGTEVARSASWAEDKLTATSILIVTDTNSTVLCQALQPSANTNFLHDIKIARIGF